MRPESDRFDTRQPELCTALRWKGQYILAEPDPSIPPTNDGLFWCVYTQNCLGPDGDIAEPGNCKPGRACHGTGKCG